MLWSAWGLGGFLQFLTGRYLRKFYSIHMWAHAIIGTYSLAVTLIVVYKTWIESDMEIGESPHHLIGIIFAFCSIGLSIGGWSGFLGRRYCFKWNVDKRMTWIKFVHRNFGYLMILVGHVEIFFGILNYYADQ